MVDEALFEWDEAKSTKTLRERGFGFDYASQIFAGNVLEEEDRRNDYGEQRFFAIGRVDEELLVVIYTRAMGGAESFPAVGQTGESEMPIVRRSLSEIIKSKPKADLERIRSTTDAEIEAQIASDPDTPPEMTLDRDWRKLVTPNVPDIRALRRTLGLSQSQFASKFGFSVPFRSGSKGARFRIAPPASC
jgi:uncharacterized DUF497 family protein/DNA-binding transcriptional regulator YiaG